MKTKIYGKYEAQKLIGQGSFGKVYLATHNKEKFALKCIPKKTRTLNEIRNLKSETQLLKKVNHENIIAMKECFETPEELIVVMEYAGDDLSKLLEKEKKLSEEKVREYGKQILDAMFYLHQNRIIHRDLKPQNILLNLGVIKICDFGFAKKMSASTNFLRSIKGTPLYIAPEILQSKPYTHKVDVWSLGIILYELAYGKTPFHAHTIQQLQPKILHECVKYPRDMSPLLKQLIDGMLQKSDVKRFDWQQVKNHKFFNEVVIKPSIQVSPVLFQQQIKQKVQQIKWDSEQQSAYILKMDRQIQENKIELKELKYKEQFSLRVIRLFGEICLQRSKISKEVLLKTIKIIIKISMIKPEGKDQDNDITKNKTLMTAIITLAFDQNDQDLLPYQLELVGYLLKQNFDGIKIDTEYDDQITTLIARKLSNKHFSRKSINFCFKVLGILASQAITTLSNSQQFFQRMSDEKILSLVAELYSPEPDHAIALEVIQKFIHPTFECNINISHRVKSLFKGFKEEVTPILIKKMFINDESPVHKKWKKSSDLQIYCGVLWQLLNQSPQLRIEYSKRSYWKDLITKRQTKMYFLAMTYSMLKGSGIFQLTPQFIQNEIIVESSQNKLTHVFLLYFAHHIMVQHHNAASMKEKKKRSIENIRNLLQTEDSIKRKSCKDLLGFFSQGSKFFNKILIDILYKLIKDCKQQQLINDAKTIISEAMMLPLCQESLLQLLELSEKHSLQFSNTQVKRLDEIFVEMIKKDGFQDYLSVNATNCSKLLRYLLNVQNLKVNNEKEILHLCQLIEQNHLHRLFFSEQILNEDLLNVVLKIINKLITKIKGIDIIATLGLQAIKKYFKTNLQDLRIQIMIFASHLARFKHEYCHELIQNGIVSFCFKCLGQNDDLLKEKTLHLIGNLSKHDDKAFDDFGKYNILSLTHKCISQNKSNKRILKNTIYAIGNISYYSQKFAAEIRPSIKYLAEGLIMEDQHLLLNTVSTISNLLRHGPIHLQSLIENGIFDKILDIYSRSTVVDHINYISNMLRKAIKYNEFYRSYPKDILKGIIETNVKKAKGDVIHLLKLKSEVC